MTTFTPLRVQAFGLVGAIIVGTVAGITVRTLPQAPPGAMLGFAGSLIGAALAVSGSVIVFSWQEAQKRGRVRAFVRDALQQVLSALATVEQGTGSGVDLIALEAAIGRVFRIEQIVIADGLDLVRAFEEYGRIDAPLKTALRTAATGRASYHTSMDEQTAAALRDAVAPVRAHVVRALAFLSAP